VRSARGLFPRLKLAAHGLQFPQSLLTRIFAEQEARGSVGGLDALHDSLTCQRRIARFVY
jgi:hypothetical protein